MKVDQSGVSAPLRNLAQEFKSREPEENREHRFVLLAESKFGNVLLFNYTKGKEEVKTKRRTGDSLMRKTAPVWKRFCTENANTLIQADV